MPNLWAKSQSLFLFRWNSVGLVFMLLNLGVTAQYPAIFSYLSKTDTFETGTSCPSKRDVRLIESQIEGAKKGRDQL